MALPISYVETADGVSIAVWKHAAGPPIVILPFFPWVTLDRAAAMIEARGPADQFAAHVPGHQIVRYDMRGLGRSGGRFDPTLETQLTDLQAVLDDLPPGRIPLVAPRHSGPAAITYAHAHPERVSLLVLWASYADPRDFFDTPRTRALRRLVELDWDVYLRNTWLEIAGWEASNLSMAFPLAGTPGLTPEVISRAFGELPRNDVSHLLSTLAVPTLVMQPQDARSPTIASAQRLAGAIPGAQLLPLTGDAVIPLPADAPAVQAAILGALDRASSLPKDQDLSPLTARQTEVLALVAAGLANAEIAGRIGISHSTVKKDLARSYERLQVHNRSQAVSRARELLLLP